MQGVQDLGVRLRKSDEVLDCSGLFSELQLEFREAAARFLVTPPIRSARPRRTGLSPPDAIDDPAETASLIDARNNKLAEFPKKRGSGAHQLSRRLAFRRFRRLPAPALACGPICRAGPQSPSLRSGSCEQAEGPEEWA